MDADLRDITDPSLVEKILLDSTYSADHPFRDTRVAIGKSMVDTDGHQHDLVKGIVAPFFNQDNVERFSSAIEALVGRTFDRIAGRSEIDVVNDIAFPVSMKTSFLVFSIDETFLDYIRPRLEDIALFITGDDISVDVATSRRRDVEEFIQEQWRDPDLTGPLSALYRAQAAGTISPSFALHNATLLLVSSVSTSVAAICLVFSHLSHEEAQVIENDHGLMARWIADLLRCQPPLTKVSRFRKARGKERGLSQSADCVNLSLVCGQGQDGSSSGRSLSFGMGEHACPGSRLALRELNYVTRALVRRIRPTSKVTLFEERAASINIPRRMIYSW